MILTQRAFPDHEAVRPTDDRARLIRDAGVLFEQHARRRLRVRRQTRPLHQACDRIRREALEVREESSHLHRGEREILLAAAGAASTTLHRRLMDGVYPLKKRVDAPMQRGEVRRGSCRKHRKSWHVEIREPESGV